MRVLYPTMKNEKNENLGKIRLQNIFKFPKLTQGVSKWDEIIIT